MSKVLANEVYKTISFDHLFTFLILNW